MIQKSETLTAAASEDIVDTLAFALRFNGKKRRHDADDMMAGIVAKRLVEHLALCGFVIMKKPPAEGGAALLRGHEQQNR
jgi:hypothetical protein